MIFLLSKVCFYLFFKVHIYGQNTEIYDKVYSEKQISLFISFLHPRPLHISSDIYLHVPKDFAYTTAHWFFNLALCCIQSLQSCPTLCDPIDYSLPGSSVHGILQARTLEWVAIAFSRYRYIDIDIDIKLKYFTL